MAPVKCSGLHVCWIWRYTKNNDYLFSSPTTHKLYACRFSADNLWYRVLVYDFDANHASVLYLYHGNRECVQFSHLHSLESAFCSLPIQTVCCRLAGITANAEANQIFAQKVRWSRLQMVLTQKVRWSYSHTVILLTKGISTVEIYCNLPHRRCCK